MGTPGRAEQERQVTWTCTIKPGNPRDRYAGITHNRKAKRMSNFIEG